MSGEKNSVPNKVVDVLVSEVFRKNNVNLDNVKTKLSDEQKESIKQLVEELKGQVDDFLSTKKDK